ncbi:MAG: Flagellar secretion chaperone FliS [Gemmatimonadaceae bacterium]|nr:Flagellar secretion chaperone FliS [Gemmatimonadaceae bacterium]
MSYGQAAKQASRYRETQVLAASPGELIVLVYDHLLMKLARAQHATGPHAIDSRSEALENARAAVCELLVTLDREKGGALAAQLVSIYSFLLGELATLGVRPDAHRFERVIGIVKALREAFQAAVESTTPTAAPA